MNRKENEPSAPTSPPRPKKFNRPGWRKRLARPAKSSGNIFLILIAMTGGVVFGRFFPEMQGTMASFGKLFMSLLQMCALPIIIVSVISAPRRLVSEEGDAGSAGRSLLIAFSLNLLLAVCVAVIIGLFVRPGHGLDPVALDFIDRTYAGAQDSINSLADKDVSLLLFLIQVVPENIFSALSSGNVASIIFFCLLAGTAMTRVTRGAPVRYFFGLCDEVEKAVSVLLGWFLRILPLGLFCLAASQTYDLGSPMMYALRNYVRGLLICYGILLVIYFSIFILVSGCGVIKGMKELMKPFLVAFGTQSSLASLPVIRETLGRQKKLEQERSYFFAAIGITLNPAASVAFYAMTALFLIQIYDAPITPVAGLIVCLGAILAGVAGVNIPGLAALNMLSVVAEPLGLPYLPMVVLMTAIYPIIDSALTGVNVVANTAISALLGKPGTQGKK